MMVLGAVFVVIGGACLFFTVGLARQECRLADGQQTTAEVIDVVVEQKSMSDSHGRRTRTYYYPVVRFQTSTGQWIEAKSPYADSGGATVGGVLSITYSPEDPTLFRTKGSSLGALGIAITGGVGGLFFLLGIAFLLISLG